jgi:hypothetical protein
MIDTGDSDSGAAAPGSEVTDSSRKDQDFIGIPIPTWQQLRNSKGLSDVISSTSQYDRERIPGIPNDREVKPRFTVDKKLNQKISLWRGDITCLRIDAIVNSSNPELMVGEVNIAVHVAAGKGLMNEWWKIESCTPGGAVLTGGIVLLIFITH